MKIHNVDGSSERTVLIGMITCKEVLSQIAAKHSPEMFFSKHANLLASWCIKYYEKYNRAPNKSVENLFQKWAARCKDKELATLLDNFLSSLSGEYESLGQEVIPQFTLDLAGDYFNKVKLTRLKETLELELESNALDKAEEAVNNFSRVEMGVGAGVHLFLDEEAVKSTFAQSVSDPLIEYPEALGAFFSNILERDQFVAYCGAQKAGKSRHLVDLSWRAMLNRKRVAFFEIGDLTESEVKELFLVRAAQHPIRSNDNSWPYKVNYPTSISLVKGDDDPKVTFKPLEFKKPLARDEAWTACQKVMKDQVRSKRSYFQYSCHPNLSISILGIKSILESWERLGWTADVVVIDYMDNLSAVDKRVKEPRDQVNVTWKLARALAMERHCLLVTATQTNAPGFTKRWLDRTNFSEDNRKLSHVSGMVGINVTNSEKEKGVCRLNWIVKRKGKYSTHHGPSVVGCHDLANPCVHSVW